ncbi:unnamed protein product [Mytilus coruscus]|uniref:C2H2-type domain-containing protein n=1 Tax=Mytilus coruscus TaxID=42192 RepID=A0A6J7ZUP5_MYTCO|nr:unnamed protein product [Mytilus coruscus]
MQYGIGARMPSVSNFRKAIDPARVESFIDFITSCNIIQDMPFGEKTMKLSTGKVIPTPNVIRCIAPAAIVRQYDQYCDENSIDPLGGRAFADLNSVVSQLQIPKSDSDKILKDLSDSKRYLKCDYKVHLETKSDIPDHCLSFALSDQDKLLQNDWLDHSHNKGCKNCQILTNVLQTIQQKLNDLKDKIDENLFDNMLFKTSKAVGDILDWKKHILHSKNQARAKSNIISELSEKRAFIMVDWAMKFLPRKYREGQTDWFAKRGINWHIAVCLTKGEEGLLTLTFVHFFANPIPQDSVTSASILCDIAKEVVKLKPEITNVSFYSDNAGCYKSTLTTALLYANLGPLITSYDFCEAQDGKGPCDRKSSHIKSEIKRYVNEGHDVLDAKGMKQAIDSRGNKTYMCKVVEECESLKPTVKSIPNITSYTYFSYSESGLTVWRGFGIGKGMHIPWSKVTDLSQIVTMTLKITNTSENISFRDIKIQHIKPQEINQQEQIELDISEDDSAAISNPENSGGIFCCPVSGCTKSFLKHKSLEDHIIIWNCQFQSKCQSTSDTYKNLYALMVTQAVGHCFNLNQKKFLNEKFQIGQITGKKEDPVSVSLEMQSAVLNGKRRFKREEFLVPQQIASYFSRYSRQMNSKYNDGIAAKSENETSIITQEVLANINADT